MLKHATLLAVLISLAQLCNARNSGSLAGPVNTDRDSVTAAIPDPKQMLMEILDASGLINDFEIKEGDVMNLQASMKRRKRVILYNPEYIRQLNRISHDKWSVMALVAHEVAHHLNGHTLRKGGSSPEVELEADEFAGFVLFKLGASLEQAQKVMNYIAGEKASGTHPGRTDRKLAIQKGWRKAGGRTAIAI